LAQLEAAPGQADARWTAGILRLKREDLEAAHEHLHSALQAEEALGTLYAKYEVKATVALPVTEEVTAYIDPRPRGIRLALAELHQLREQPALAREHLRLILADTPDDVVVKAALAELLLEAEPVPPADADRVVQLSAGLENATPVHAALLLYKGRALRALGMDEAAVKTFTQAYRRKKDRPDELLRQVRYDRALAYAAIGRRSRSRRELEAIYAEAPGFEDVAVRLGVQSG
jgi:tetratricopeptide (TPR) repeat protein